MREKLVEGEPAAQSVAALISTLSPEQWPRQLIQEGSKDPLMADFVALRVINVRHRLPGQAVWLVCRRDVFRGETKYYLSNAPADTPLPDFVRVSGMRWPSESCFEESKQELGLGDYQLRSWLGWHHYMTLVILAHFFLVRVQRPARAGGAKGKIEFCPVDPVRAACYNNEKATPSASSPPPLTYA